MGIGPGLQITELSFNLSLFLQKHSLALFTVSFVFLVLDVLSLDTVSRGGHSVSVISFH